MIYIKNDPPSAASSVLLSNMNHFLGSKKHKVIFNLAQEKQFKLKTVIGQT